MVLELKTYSITITIREVWKLKDNNKKCLLKMKTQIKHHFKKLRCAFVVRADFDCLTEELKNLKVMKLKPTSIKNINLADLC